jgi:cob(I)alamin adenosyltransferase
MIQIYTGNGKGKTTAAIGQAVRAAGAGIKVIFFQFLKYGAFPGSEEKMLKKCGIKVVRFNEKSPLFDKKTDLNELRVQVANDWTVVTAAIKSGKYDMVVLDEATHLINLKLISEKRVLKDVQRPTSGVQLVLTGRDATNSLIKTADLVTEMKEVKHSYKKGVKARCGIEF